MYDVLIVTDVFVSSLNVLLPIEIDIRNNQMYINDMQRSNFRFNLHFLYMRILFITVRFIEPPVKFYWGEAVETSLKNLRQVYKDEKDKRKGKRK